MQIHNTVVESNNKIGVRTFLIKVHASQLADQIKPGQFCNIKVSETSYPLLRRPFSICDVDGEYVFFMYDLYGEGTKILSKKVQGDPLDILGPLGNGFTMNSEYDTIVLVAGGIGAAPFPFVTRELSASKTIITYLGGRTKDYVITYGLKNVLVSTDDGSEGMKGTVVDLLESNKGNFTAGNVMFFGCGPNPMLSALRKFCMQNNYDCEISTEAAMACGFGICQGCPIDSTEKDKFHLVCKDGPVFNIKDVEL